jgi:Tfp pilus assembly protein PilX
MGARADCKREDGATLIVALIMLLLMTMVAVAALNMGKSSLQIVSNLQGHNQAVVTANAVNEAVISSTQFFQNPSGSVLGVNGTWTNTTTVDVYGDGKTVLNVNVSPDPKCLTAQPIPVTKLDLSIPDDAGCAVQQQQTFGQAGTISANSICANSVWEIRTQASDTVTSASGTVVQGTAVRIGTDNEATSCP